MDTKIFTDFWLAWWAFVLFILLTMYWLKKAIDFIPNAIKQHFEAISEMQDKFSDNLDRITDKNAKIAEWFIFELSNITKEHEKQNAKLDAIHNDLKLLKK